MQLSSSRFYCCKGPLGIKVVLSCLLTFCKVAHFARVMVLAEGDHCASKVALAYLLASHRVARSTRIGY
jgi:hypothetical protein